MKISEKFNQLPLAAKTTIVWAGFFLPFAAINLATPGYWDDGYYHARHAYKMVETGNLTYLDNWIAFNFLSYAPVDPWWGFHLIQAAFIYLFGLFAGVKLAAAALSSLIFAVYYWLISRLSIRKPLIWTILFFSSSALFQFRLLLERPFIVALSVLPLGWWLINRRKYPQLFVLSLVFALLYNLSPLIIFLSFVYLLAEWFVAKKINLRPLITATAGVIAGVALHPEGLNYVFVMVVHIWQVLYLRFSGVFLPIGGEVQQLGFQYTVSFSFIAIVLYMISVALFFSDFKKNRRDLTGVFLFLFSFGWFALMFTVPRTADFWMPFAWLFIAYVVSRFFSSDDFGLAKQRMKGLVGVDVLSKLLLAIAAVLVLNNLLQVSGVRYDKLNGPDRDQYFAEATDWLKANTKPGTLIFADNWSYFPKVYFFDQQNKQLAGFDPTFFYEYDNELYWLWYNLSNSGLYCNRPTYCTDISEKESIKMIPHLIKERFGTDIILARNDPRLPFTILLEKDRKHYELKFINSYFRIYRVL